jgi:transcriptional regulator with XRE-family HTH domain
VSDQCHISAIFLFIHFVGISCGSIGCCIAKSGLDIIITELLLIPEGGVTMDLQAIGARIKATREAKGMTQEDLAAALDLSRNHISVIERGVKAPKLDTFVAIANELGVSADVLLFDVIDHASDSVSSDLMAAVSQLPKADQNRILNAIRALLEK